MDKLAEAVEKINLEFRRGSLVMAVLLLMDKPQYGYYLVDELSKKGLKIDQNTLYPLLRRLESQGLLKSSWDTSGRRPRRYYEISDFGRQVRCQVKEDWIRLVESLEGLMEEKND